jgi:hypothetical protein
MLATRATMPNSDRSHVRGSGFIECECRLRKRDGGLGNHPRLLEKPPQPTAAEARDLPSAPSAERALQSDSSGKTTTVARHARAPFDRCVTPRRGRWNPAMELLRPPRAAQAMARVLLAKVSRLYSVSKG